MQDRMAIGNYCVIEIVVATTRTPVTFGLLRLDVYGEAWGLSESCTMVMPSKYMGSDWAILSLSGTGWCLPQYTGWLVVRL